MAEARVPKRTASHGGIIPSVLSIVTIKTTHSGSDKLAKTYCIRPEVYVCSRDSKVS